MTTDQGQRKREQIRREHEEIKERSRQAIKRSRQAIERSRQAISESWKLPSAGIVQTEPPVRIHFQPGADQVQRLRLHATPSQHAKSISPYLRDQQFDPDLIETMSRAFTQACAKLGLSGGPDVFTALVAGHVIDAAQCGMRTKTALYLTALSDFKANPH